jgi:hypothetical protein
MPNQGFQSSVRFVKRRKLGLPFEPVIPPARSSSSRLVSTVFLPAGQSTRSLPRPAASIVLADYLDKLFKMQGRSDFL